ncbi:MAG: HEPN domain-containing protein [Thermoflexaceae bacterium]|nr:HEPN domain-containing protein [Thermoflexaceae bacterium]
MNFMFLSLNNIEIPAEKYDILPTGIIPNTEMYVISPECTFTYNGKNVTSIVDASPIQEDLGKYDWYAMMRKPMIAVWTETEELELQFNSKEEADAYYTPKELFYSDIVFAFTMATWFVKDCCVYSDSYYWCNMDNYYTVKGKRSFQQTNASGKMEVTSFNQKEIEDVYGYLALILDIFHSAIENHEINPYESLYSQGTLICNTESAVKNEGSSFYRILLLLQLARKTGFLPEKISMYCAILECLFAIEKNHRKNISEMTAKFVAANSEEKTMIERDMKDAYSVRSDFVHGDVNTLFETNEQIVMLSGRLDDYVRRAVRKAFVDENCKYENTDEDKKRVRQYFELIFTQISYIL